MKKKKIFLIPKNLSARNVSFGWGFNKHKIKLVKENYKILLENSEINKIFDKNTINSKKNSLLFYHNIHLQHMLLIDFKYPFIICP